MYNLFVGVYWLYIKIIFELKVRYFINKLFLLFIVKVKYGLLIYFFGVKGVDEYCICLVVLIIWIGLFIRWLCYMNNIKIVIVFFMYICIVKVFLYIMINMKKVCMWKKKFII